MFSVVAFEGTLDITNPISWGIAALADDSVLWNPVTGRYTSVARLNDLVSKDALSRLPVPIPVKEEYHRSPLLVAAVSASTPNVRLLLIGAGERIGLVADKMHDGFIFYVFRDITDFDRYANNRIELILKSILHPSSQDSGAIALIDLGLVLNRSHPALNAIRSHLSSSLLAEEICRANVDGVEVSKFDELLSLLRTSNVRKGL